MEAKRQKRSPADRQEQQDNNREVGNVGAYDVVSTYQGLADVETIVITTIHDVLFSPQPLGTYYVLPLMHTREYCIEAYNVNKQPIVAPLLTFWGGQMKRYGCKITSCTKSIGELRGFNETQMSAGANTVTQRVIDLQAELEWACDSAGCIPFSTFKEEEQYKYLEKDGGLPTTDLTKALNQYDGHAFNLTDAVTAQCFNERGVIQGPDHKSWTVRPLADRWYSFDPSIHEQLPYWQPHYKPTIPQDGVEVAPADRNFDITSVYFRVKQLDPKIQTYIRALVTTKMEMIVRKVPPRACRRDYSQSLCGMQAENRYTDENGVIWQRIDHMFSTHQ